MFVADPDLAPRHLAFRQLRARVVAAHAHLLESLSHDTFGVFFFHPQGGEGIFIQPGQRIAEIADVVRRMPGGKLRRQHAIEFAPLLGARKPRGWDVELVGNRGKGRHSVVRRQRNPDVRQPNLMPEKIEEVRKFLVDRQCHGLHLGRIRPDFVPQNVIRRQADDQEIGRRTVSQLLVGDQFACEFEFVVIPKGSRADQCVEISRLSRLGLGRAQYLSLIVLPLLVQIFPAALAVIEALDPRRELAAVEGGGNPGATLLVDPISSIARETRRQHRRPVFQCDPEHARLACGCELQLIAQCVGQQIVGRSPRLAARDAHQFGRVILDRGDHALFLRVPPLIGQNAVTVGISSGQQGCVSGRRGGVGVIETAVGEVGAVVGQQPEPAFAQMIGIPRQVVTAELVNHHDHNQLGACVVSGGEAEASQAEPGHKPGGYGPEGESHCGVVYSLRWKGPSSAAGTQKGGELPLFLAQGSPSLQGDKVSWQSRGDIILEHLQFRVVSLTALSRGLYPQKLCSRNLDALGMLPCPGRHQVRCRCSSKFSSWKSIPSTSKRISARV